MAIVTTSRLRAVAAVAATGLVGIGLTMRHQAARLHANDLAQRATSAAELSSKSSSSSSSSSSSTRPPNLYVSVERSGGGV